MLLRVVGLLLPALIPSWRFFKAIGPSPRVEYRVIQYGHPEPWRAERQLRQSVTLSQMLGRLFWNPQWNEHLFLVSLSERVVAEESDQAARMIKSVVARNVANAPNDALLQVRLVFLSREDGEIAKAVAYESHPAPLAECR